MFRAFRHPLPVEEALGEPSRSNPSITPLPYDLERMIFEMAAREGGDQVVMHLMLVAKCVCDWVRPELYRIFTQVSDREMDTFPRPDMNLDDVGRFAYHLIIGGSRTSDEISRFLTACPNVYNLAIWSTEPIVDFLPQLRLLPLRRLSANFRTLSDDEWLEPPFCNLEYIDVVRMRGHCWEDWNVLATLPRLTHIAVNSIVELQVIHNLLSECRHLKSLVLLANTVNWSFSDAQELAGIRDDRLVLLEDTPACDNLMDWRLGARGKGDFWRYAEQISFARRAKLESTLGSTRGWISSLFNLEDHLNDEGKLWYASFG
ncbi:unnamed protein product [Cyclocybe aegerita]|uniref:Uncharacterized protein n=1 Tax=Cyclocybe aegerita TaxID=1973307 RepID=A0A8S0WFM1_CYCAE|nr:unnamed protein product [Cyclocybe aegerita]